MSFCCRLREAGINTDYFRASFVYCFLNPLKGNGMIGSGIASHN